MKPGVSSRTYALLWALEIFLLWLAVLLVAVFLQPKVSM